MVGIREISVGATTSVQALIHALHGRGVFERYVVRPVTRSLCVLRDSIGRSSKISTNNVPRARTPGLGCLMNALCPGFEASELL